MDNLCKCEKPEINILEGNFNCGGEYICPCHKCGKILKSTKKVEKKHAWNCLIFICSCGANKKVDIIKQN